MGAAPTSVSFTRTVSQTIKAKTRGWDVYEFDWEPVVLTASLACSEQPHHSACLTVRPAHRCSVSDRACASCVIPKTCGCYSSAVNEVVRFIKVNKVQFSKLPGTQLFLVPQTVQLNCPCSTSSSPAGRSGPALRCLCSQQEEKWQRAPCPPPPHLCLAGPPWSWHWEGSSSSEQHESDLFPVVLAEHSMAPGAVCRCSLLAMTAARGGSSGEN